MVSRLGPIPEHALDGGPAVDAVDAGDPVERWLAVLVRLLDLPEDDRQGIRREIDAHVRERVRDLMIDGHAEEQAVRLAIEELGETVELARSFRTANRYPGRRLLMNFAVSAVGAGLVGLGIVALQSGGDEPLAGRPYRPLGEVVDDGALDRRVDVRFDDSSLGDVIGFLGEQLDRTVFVHWRELEDYGIDRMTTQVSFEARSLPVRRLMELIRESIDDEWSSIRWMVSDDLVELGSGELFDRRDIALVSYDITPIIDVLASEYALEYDAGVEQVTGLLMELVSPDRWHAMGGNIAQLHVVGGRMFVEAPPRMHHEVSWILGELAGPSRTAAASGGGSAR